MTDVIRAVEQRDVIRIVDQFDAAVRVSTPVVSTISTVIVSMIKTHVAGQSLSALRCVSKGSDGKLHYTNPDDATDALSVVGITTAAAITGEMVPVCESGTMADGFWRWTPGQMVFVDRGGLLTQSIPDTAYLIRAGWSTTSTEIYVNIEILRR